MFGYCLVYDECYDDVEDGFEYDCNDIEQGGVLEGGLEFFFGVGENVGEVFYFDEWFGFVDEFGFWIQFGLVVEGLFY